MLSFFVHSRRVRHSVWGVGATLLALTFIHSSKPAAQAGYTLEALPAPATDVNDNGEVVGPWIGPNGSRAYIWTQATGAQPMITDAAIINRFPCSAPKINANGVVVAQGSGGTSCGTVPLRAARYVSGVGLTVASTSQGDNGQTALAVNASGTAVGIFSGNSTQPFVWVPGGPLTVPFPFNGPNPAGGAARGINDAGVMVGYCSGDSFSDCPGRQHAYSWQNDVRIILPAVAGHLNDNHEALAINNNGVIVGRYSGNGGSGAFLSSIAGGPVTTIDLLAPPGSVQQMDINDAGDIVASINLPGGGGVPYLYRNGVWTNINALRPPGSTLQIETATAINNLGWIVGSGPVGVQGYVLIPPPPNSAPTASDSSTSTFEDTSVSGTLSATDPNGDTLTYSIVNNGSLGTAVITNTATGAFTYTPAPDANGTDVFTFTASDGTASSNVAQVTVSIGAENDAPVAQDGSNSVISGSSVSGTLLATDIDGPALVYALVSNGTKGTAVVTNPSTGAYTYTANAGASGSDTFTFKASDGSLESNVATITLTVATTNRPPVASNSTLTTLEDKSANGTLSGSDPDGNRPTFAIVSNGSKGTATITNASNGRFTYVPTPNAFGTDSFTFRASDGSAFSNIATVAIAITSVNDAPAAADVSHTTARNTPLNATLVAADVDGDVLTYSIVKSPRRGSITAFNPATGAFTYTPPANFTGTDSFTFRVSDGSANSMSATVSITIN